MREKFDDAVARLGAFIEQFKLGELTPNQWEVTYVNHLPKGSVWSTSQEHLSALKLDGDPSVDDLELESVGLQFRYVIPDNRGRLHVESRQNKDHIQLTLTARGPAKTMHEVGVGLDVGREAIVNAFDNLTSARAQKEWRRL